MWDFFAEVCQFDSQIVTLVNWFVSTARNFVTMVHGSSAVTWVTSVITQCPPIVSGAFSIAWAAAVFDFIRGR